MGWRELLEVDLYPFRKAVESGAASIMPAYNEIDGTPCTVNTELLDHVLREDWGFEGLVITDCGAINMLAGGHDVAADGLDASVQAIQAGIDMEMSGEMFGQYLVQAVSEGKLDVQVLDQAVSRVLALKFKLGLFEQPYVDADRAADVIGSEQHIQLARQLAAEGVVLLKMSNRLSRYPYQELGRLLSLARMRIMPTISSVTIHHRSPNPKWQPYWMVFAPSSRG